VLNCLETKGFGQRLTIPQSRQYFEKQTGTNRTHLLFLNSFGKCISFAGGSVYFILELVPGILEIGYLQTKIVIFIVELIQPLQQRFLLALNRLSIAEATKFANYLPFSMNVVRNLQH
jgi:hypothetical protein